MRVSPVSATNLPTRSYLTWPLARMRFAESYEAMRPFPNAAPAISASFDAISTISPSSTRKKIFATRRLRLSESMAFFTSSSVSKSTA